MAGTRQPPELLQPSGRPRRWLFALTVALPLLLTALALALDRQPSQAVAEGAGFHGLRVLAVVFAVAVPLWWWLERAMRRHRIELRDDRIDLHTSFYRRQIALGALRLEEARLIDLKERPGYRLLLKTNGFSVPGFHSGWFRLRNGEKALAAGIGESRTLWLPTTQGYGLWLQVRQPRALLDTLREMARARPGR